MIKRIIFYILAICVTNSVLLSINAQQDHTRKMIEDTNRTEAVFELVCNEATNLTPERKEQLLEFAQKAIERREQEARFLQFWRDYKTLGVTALFSFSTYKCARHIASGILNFMEKEALGLRVSSAEVLPLGMAYILLYPSVIFTIMYGIKLFRRSCTKERLEDAILIKKTIENINCIENSKN